MVFKEVFRTRNKTKIIFPETDERILKAISIAEKKDYVKPIIVGKITEIKKKTKELGIDITKWEIISSKKPLEDAAKLLKAGKAKAMVAGVENTTGEIVRAGLKIVGLKKGVKTASSFFIMDLPKPLIFADGGIVPEPTAEQLVDIALMTGENAKKLGFEPRIAMLSFSTKGSASPKFNDVGKVAKAVKLAGKDYIDGEMQVDSALRIDVAQKKMKKLGKVAGRANILVFPNLAAANISYKLVQILTGTKAYGPILQGFKKPISDLSRGATVADIIGVIAIMGKLTK